MHNQFTIRPIRPNEWPAAKSLIYSVAHAHMEPQLALEEYIATGEKWGFFKDLDDIQNYYFANDGVPEYFIGSADLMTRNLESRVEVVTPVEDPALCEELRAIFDAQLGDRRSAWEMQPDGSYVQRHPGKGAEVGSQQALITAAERRYNEANRLRKRRPQSIARRSPTDRAVI